MFHFEFQSKTRKIIPGDPQGEMCVTPGGYANMMRMLQNTGLPVALIYEVKSIFSLISIDISTFQGGYFLESDAAAGEWVIRMLLGEQPPAIKREVCQLSHIFKGKNPSPKLYRG